MSRSTHPTVDAAALLRSRIPTAGDRFDKLEHVIRAIGLALAFDDGVVLPELRLEEGDLRALRALIEQADEQIGPLRRFALDLDGDALEKPAPDDDEHTLLDALGGVA